MDDELRAEAERLILGQYRVTVRSLTGADDAAQMAFDRYHVARAYLADLDAKRQREAEDALPVTEEWYRSIGFEPLGATMLSIDIPSDDGNGESVKLYVLRDCQSFHAGLIQPTFSEREEDHVVLTGKQMLTRRDVRRLLEALGVEVSK